MNLWDLIDMSKLVDAVEAVTDNRRRYKPEKLFAQLVDVKAEFDKDFSISYQTRYQIRAKIGAAAWIDDGGPTSLERAVEQTKRSIIEAVFGEFRPYFRELQMAIWDGKSDKEIKEILDRFEKQMFESDSFE